MAGAGFTSGDAGQATRRHATRRQATRRQATRRQATRRQAPALVAAFLGVVLALGSVGAAVTAAHDRGSLLPVIVRQSGNAGAAEQSVLSLGGQIGRRLSVINGFSARVPALALARLETMAGIDSVTADVSLTPLSDAADYDPSATPGSMYNVARQVGARWYWALGLTGKGVDVAVIDTGLSPLPGLTTNGKYVHGPDLSFERQLPNLRNLDTYGHGTHLAGVIAGRDPGISYPATADEDEFLGIAPGARIVSLKVANAMGATDVSQVIAAIDWVIANRKSDGLNIRVLNLSFGTDGVQHYTLDPLSYAVEQAWHAGIVVVVAGGNAGFGSAKLNNPAYNPYVIAVGANNTRGTTSVRDDVVPAFSSTGDKHRNPDLVAPGKSVVSLRVPGSQLDLSHPEGRLGKRYLRGSGTSQAAAVVSGAAALVIQQRPKITPDQLKDLLTSSSLELPNADPVAQGNGMLYLGTALLRSTNKGATQDWPRASGTGSLDAARGNLRVSDPNGVELRGEIDIFGRPFDTEQSWDAWSGNSWSGNSWSGYSWIDECERNSWNGNSWSGNSWSGNSWSSHGWLGVSWGRRWQ